MKTFPRIAVFIGCVIALCGVDGFSAQTATTRPYEQMLYDLGAFPVARLTKPYWTNGNPGKVYGKGERIDVDGWVPPYWAPQYLTDAEKIKYGIPKKPLTYDQYLAMLDIDGYKRTHDPELFMVMRFTLEDLLHQDIAIKKDDIIRVYEAQIGLQSFALNLLRGQLSSEDTMRLVQKYGDDGLFGWKMLPVPAANDVAYIEFLNEQANAAKWSIYARDNCFGLLFGLDDKKYRKPYRDFLLANVKTAQDWADRSVLYSGMIQLSDDPSLLAAQQGLIHDPVTECREAILYDLQQKEKVPNVIVDALLVIANGKDDPHHAVMPSRMSEQWHYKLNEYLKWAQTQKQLDETTLKKVRDAAAILANVEWRQNSPSAATMPGAP